MTVETPSLSARPPAGLRPFRRAVIRGLAVLCPPLLTVLIFVWAINTTKSYFLEPVTTWARDGLVWCLWDVRTGQQLQDVADGKGTFQGKVYRQVARDRDEYIQQYVYEGVIEKSVEALPTTADGYYRRYIDLTFLRPYVAIPFFLSVLILLLYFLGKFMAVGIGAFVASSFDRAISRLPGVRRVYSSVKQVTDFLFSTRNLQQSSRIVAVEYPRKGIWSIGFVTGESIAPIHDAADEPVLAVMMPCSPMPITGYTIIVRKSECIDLNLTFDQACQFIISCGVVIPPQQLWHIQMEKGD